MTEFYLKHRPTTFKGVIGQPAAVSVLNDLVVNSKVPHAIIFTGPSGCGKTTLARLLAIKLGCRPANLEEVNAADTRGVDSIRDIRRRMGLKPHGGGCRIWIVDEAHKLTNDAQNAFLKYLEDTPRHVYFFLCTTEPAKIIKTIHTRCTEIRCVLMKDADLAELVRKIAKRESLELSDDVVDRLVECAEGSARKALVDLNKIAGLETDEDRLKAILSNDAKRQGIDLARALLDPKARWGTVKAILKNIEEEAETIRQIVLGYCTAVLIGDKTNSEMLERAAMVLREFQFDFDRTRKAGLSLACWQAVNQK